MVHTVDMMLSLKFEISALIIQVISLIFYLNFKMKLTMMTKPKNKILAMFLHHWTVSRTMNDDADDANDHLSTE